MSDNTIHLDDETALAPQVRALLDEWGIPATIATESLITHAERCLSLKGKQVGAIAVSLGLIDEAMLSSVLRSKPVGVKTLTFLHDRGVVAVSQRSDEILCVQSSVPFLARKVADLAIHPIAQRKETYLRVRDELFRRDVVPLVSENGQPLLLFGDFDKMSRFSMLGKSERLSSEFFSVMAKELGTRPELVGFKLAVADAGVFLSYQQRLADGGHGESGVSDTLQTLRQHEAENDSVMSQLVTILNRAIQNGINDVAIIPNRENGRALVFFRKYQRLINSEIELTPQDRESLVRLLQARSKANPSGGRLRHPADGNLNYEGRYGEAFLRMSFIPLEESAMPATSVSIRILPKTTSSIELKKLGIHPGIEQELEYFSHRKYGLFVVCGPTGSGKSTTIGGMLCAHHDQFGNTMKRVSVEQPCERILPGVQHIDVSQHHYIGAEDEVDKFSMALRAILRHDPDLIFVGEVRDKESCMVSIDAANTGHLVFTTTHANDPVLGYRRLASFLDKERRFDLVNVLEGILAQRLVSLLCPHCKQRSEFTEENRNDLIRYGRNKGVNTEALTMPQHHFHANEQGCEHCVGGYAGMKPVHGLLTMNPRVRELLLSPNESDWMKAQEASDSPYTLFSGAFDLFCAGQADLGAIML